MRNHQAEKFRFQQLINRVNVGSSKNTVTEVTKQAEKPRFEWPLQEFLSNQMIEKIFYPERGANEEHKLPDFEYILKKLGVTHALIWGKYCAKCEQEHTIPYQRT